ncbi:MAG: lysylphosphatidylglycerol synthase domain-containing protein, partial [Gammaproteobacteria bacterium]
MLLAIALLAFALGISDLGRVWAGISHIPLHTLAAALLLAFVYLALKGVQFHFLLGRLGIAVPWRTLALAFVIGEMTLTVPSGIYVQNYVLRRTGMAGFARSSAATTMTLVIEGALVLLALLVLSVPGWKWVRPLAFVAVTLLIGSVLFAGARTGNADTLAWLQRGRFVRLGRALAGFVESMRELSNPGAMLPAAILGGLYMFALVAVFVLAAHGAGVVRLDLPEAISIYAFSLAVTLMLGGVLSQLGVIEVAGMGAAH